MPRDDSNDVEYVERNHGQTLPCVQFSIGQKDQADAGCGDEEDDIADKASSGHAERPDQGHGTGHDRSDKPRSTQELAHREAATVRAHGRKSRKHIRAPIPKCKECHARQALAHAQDARDGAQVYAEEVAGGNADGAEK